jgi:DNA-binding NtrC family response regulator
LDAKQGVKILLVDDEELIRWSLHSALVGMGYRVDQASSGDEALEKLSTLEYDIVITDYKIPGLSGLDLMEKMRQKRIRTKVILISAYLSHAAIKQANAYGAFRCVGKPFGMDDLLRVVREAAQLGITKI